MTARVLDGKALARRVLQQLSGKVAELTRVLGRPPGLGVVLVGDDAASQVYVRAKERAAREAGFHFEGLRLPGDSSHARVIAAIDTLNGRGDIDAFIVQLPLPRQVDKHAALWRIAPDKDADGLHPTNLGRVVADEPGPKPCTPRGVMALLDDADIELPGAHAIVVGRSTIVGKPLALMLLHRHCTVTLCHSRTPDLPAQVGRGDLVVAAVGVPGLIHGAWIKEGATVIDVGVNRVNGKLVGDVQYDAARLRAGAITPVPGGVGPMTVAMLLANTYDLACKAAGLDLSGGSA